MPCVLTARPLRGGRRGGPKVALLSLLAHRNRLLVLQIVTFLMARNALTPIFRCFRVLGAPGVAHRLARCLVLLS